MASWALGLWVSGIWGLGFKGSELRVWGLGFQVFGFMVFVLQVGFMRAFSGMCAGSIGPDKDLPGLSGFGWFEGCGLQCSGFGLTRFRLWVLGMSGVGCWLRGLSHCCKLGGPRPRVGNQKLVQVCKLQLRNVSETRKIMSHLAPCTSPLPATLPRHVVTAPLLRKSI